jgi:ABC-type lipoprotein export system ATPase subunit
VTLVGRQDAVAALERALAGTLAGDGRLVLLTGDAGMGKTTLLETLGPAAPDGGARLLWATGWEGLGAPAF